MRSMFHHCLFLLSPRCWTKCLNTSLDNNVAVINTLCGLYFTYTLVICSQFINSKYSIIFYQIFTQHCPKAPDSSWPVSQVSSVNKVIQILSSQISTLSLSKSDKQFSNIGSDGNTTKGSKIHCNSQKETDTSDKLKTAISII